MVTLQDLVIAREGNVKIEMAHAKPGKIPENYQVLTCPKRDWQIKRFDNCAVITGLTELVIAELEEQTLDRESADVYWIRAAWKSENAESFVTRQYQGFFKSTNLIFKNHGTSEIQYVFVVRTMLTPKGQIDFAIPTPQRLSEILKESEASEIAGIANDLSAKISKIEHDMFELKSLVMQSGVA